MRMWIVGVLLAGSASAEQPPVAVTNSPPPPIVAVPVTPPYPSTIIAPPARFAIVPPRPLVPLQGLFIPEDYPPPALRAKQEGRVVASLRVGPDGGVRECTVVGSSGWPMLDKATCSILTRRARFEPARDREWLPTVGQVTWYITWKLPPAAPIVMAPIPMLPRVQPVIPPTPHVQAPPPRAPLFTNVVRKPQLRAPLQTYFTPDDYPASALAQKQQGRVKVVLVVGPDGRVQACQISDSSGSAALDAATCIILRRRARFTPAADSNGNPVHGTVSLHYDWKLPG